MKPPKVWRTSYLCAYCRKKRGLQKPWEYRLEQRWSYRSYTVTWWEWLGLRERPKFMYSSGFYHITCKKAHELAQRLLR